ncbi:MAG: metal ABC transporter permease [Proteobacteria bacterium]|nr:metal ABC transporter permease [Pseudomonadota bacterium]
MDDFILRALVAGLGFASVAGPLGCFVVWRRMAYFGSALAHGAILGVALGFLFELSLYAGVLFVCVTLALALVALERQRGLTSDTLLGLLAHGALAFGLIAVSFLETVRVDLMAYLFGDILAVTIADIVWIYAGGALVLALLALLWRGLLAATVDADLARVEGVPVDRVRLLFLLMIAVVIAVSMKIVGVLLVVSLLIIPAATARRFSATPEQMAALASVAGALAVGLGLWASLRFDVPAGPAIVAAATGLFFLSLPVPGTRLRG